MRPEYTDSMMWTLCVCGETGDGESSIEHIMSLRLGTVHAFSFKEQSKNCKTHKKMHCRKLLIVKLVNSNACI